MRSCKRCLLPEAVPGSGLDASGICGPCREFAETNPALHEEIRKAREADLEQTIQSSPGKAEYDCLVCLSGGKDSIYLLYKLKAEYGLRVLAFTTYINIPDIAWRNIRRTVEKLGVDHLVYNPPREFYRKFFRYLLQNQDRSGAVRTVCYVCAPLFEGHALTVATEKQIPVIFAGYSPGQPEEERMVYEFSRQLIERTDWTPKSLKASGLFDESELARFWSPFRYPSGTQFPRFIAPFHAWPYSQEEVMKKVVALGLVESNKAASPIHSNCPVNWLLMYSDLKNLGYNPYNPEFSRLIREGKANRFYWKMMLPAVNFMIRKKIGLGRQVAQSLRWLGLEPKDLVIRKSESKEVSYARA